MPTVAMTRWWPLATTDIFYGGDGVDSLITVGAEEMTYRVTSENRALAETKDREPRCRMLQEDGWVEVTKVARNETPLTACNWTVADMETCFVAANDDRFWPHRFCSCSLTSSSTPTAFAKPESLRQDLQPAPSGKDRKARRHQNRRG